MKLNEFVKIKERYNNTSNVNSKYFFNLTEVILF